MSGLKYFKRLCKMTQPELKGFVLNELIKTGYKEVVSEDGYLYSKGEVPVLLCAHLDTVHKKLPLIIDNKDGRLSSPQGIGGDDRCGVYMILNIIKEVKCSVLFCEDEEIGCIGAGKFLLSKTKDDVNVNYIIEFDRRNKNDAVFYQGDNKEFEKMIAAGYFKKAFGTCSDISKLAPALGISAVNLSCGYYDEHLFKESVVFSEMETSMMEAKKIILADSTTKYKWIKCQYYYQQSFGSYWNKGYQYGGYDYDYGYGYNSYPSSSSYSRKVKNLYVITYFNEMAMEQAEEEVHAYSKAEAVGTFLMDNPDMTYSQIVSVCDAEDEYDDYYYNYYSPTYKKKVKEREREKMKGTTEKKKTVIENRFGKWEEDD